MFGQSRIKQLEQQLEAEKELNKAILNRIDNLSKLIELIKSWIIDKPNGNDLSKLDLSKLEIPPQMPPKRGGVMGM